MPTNPFTALGADDFARALAALLPEGEVYPGLAAPVQAATLRGLADVQFAQHQRAVTLSETESDPAFTLELLPDWELEYGLPDPCTPLNPTIAQRRIALLGKIASSGGQSDAYLIGVAAAMGFAITLTHNRASRAGISRAGDPLYGPECDYETIVTTADVRLIWSVAGEAVCGDPINTIDNTQLECRLRAIAPAGDYLTFVYAGG